MVGGGDPAVAGWRVVGKTWCRNPSAAGMRPTPRLPHPFIRPGYAAEFTEPDFACFSETTANYVVVERVCIL